MQLLQHFKELTIRPKNAEELKGLILQLAIQGKLTANWREQNQDIEPASELLNRIQKEKEQLVKEKKVKKEKPFPKIKDETLRLKLPENWVWSNLGESIILVSGRDLSPNEYSDTELKYPYLTGASQIKNNSIVLSRWTNTPKVLSILGDVLISVKGTIGKTVINIIGEIHIARQIMALRTNEWINKQFLKLFADSYLSKLQEASNGIIPGVSREDLLYAELPLPPLEEQKEIVNVVETLFKEVAQLEQLTVQRIGLKEDFVTCALRQLTTNNANQEWTFLQDHFKTFFNETTNIKKLRETILQLAVQGKLTADWRQQQSLSGAEVEDASQLLKRIQEEKAQLIKDKKIKKEKALPPIIKEEIPYELPKGWVWCRPYEISLNIVDCPHSTAKFISAGKACIDTTCMDDNGGLKYDKIRWVSDKTFDKRNDRLVPLEGDIIYAREGSIGKSIVIPKGLDVCLGQRVMIYRLHKSIDSFLFRYILVSPMFMEQVLGNHKGLGAKHVNMSDLRSMPVPLIPNKEQVVLLDRVNTLIGLCDALEQEVQQSQEHSKQLMKSVLGEVFN